MVLTTSLLLSSSSRTRCITTSGREGWWLCRTQLSTWRKWQPFSASAEKRKMQPGMEEIFQSNCVFWTIIIQINHKKPQSLDTDTDMCVFRRKRSCLCLQFSNYQLFPVTFLGSVRAVTVVMRVKDNSALPTLNIQGSVQLDEEFNNVREPPLSTCAAIQFLQLQKEPNESHFTETQLHSPLAQQGGAWPGPVTAGPTLASCGKIAALQLHSPHNALPSPPCGPLRQLQEWKVTEPSVSDFISF